jgi:prevent-host-death family protein
MARTMTISAAEANRSFSRLLRAAREGTRIVITSHGTPVAALSPIEGDEQERERRRAALAEMEKRWEAREPVVVGRWTREELHDRGGR